MMPGIAAYYRDNPVSFITDWGMTYDPRNLERGLPAMTPFIPFPRQVEWLEWALARWHAQEDGLTEKSRDCGVSWLAIALSCTLCIFHHGMTIGFGSRKEEYVDKSGDLKSLLEKGRMFMRGLPVEFRFGWTPEDAPHMRMKFPASDALISGEAGDNIGRGDRKALYFVDESAHLERPDLVDMALSATTNCRIDVSSVKGMANSFAIRRHSGNVPVFTFHWRDDPRKDDAWYAKQCQKLDAVVVAQEIDIDYQASVEGILIPAAWVRAAIDAHVKLDIAPTGQRQVALDVADEGRDKNALCETHGVVIKWAREWSGVNSDIFATTEAAFGHCDFVGIRQFVYDADGVGADVRGDARVINEQRVKEGKKPILALAYRGSEAVQNPEKEDVEGRKNKDFFGNRKAQAWWSVRRRFELTFLWVTQGQRCDPDEIVSLDRSTMDSAVMHKAVTELSQVTSKLNGVGKVIIDKAPNGLPSPNIADAIVMSLAGPTKMPLIIPNSTLRNVTNRLNVGRDASRFRPKLGAL